MKEPATACGTGQVFHVFSFVPFGGESKTNLSCTVPYRLARVFELVWKVPEFQCHAPPGGPKQTGSELG